MDNSIKLKELQAVSDVLRKGDEGLGTIFYLFQKGFFWVRRGGWGNSTPFQKRVFFKGLREVNFFGTGTNPKVCFLGGMGGRSLVVSQNRKVGIFLFSKELFFSWCGMGWLEKGGGYFFFVFFFLLRYGDLMKLFFKKIFYKNK